MRRILRFVAVSFAFAVVVLACGSRTGLDVDLPTPLLDSSIDRTVDAPIDAPPLIEGGPLDVKVDCPDPPTCDPSDLGYVFKCGVRIYQCSSLEQCEETCQGENCTAACVNPCVDTLGQDTSNGCEFYALEMDTVPEAQGVCYAVFLVNQWKTGEPARIEVDRGGSFLPVEQFTRIPVGTGTNIQYAPYSAQTGLAKDQVAVMFLSRDPAAENDPNDTPEAPRRLASCPAGVTPAVLGDAATHGTGRGQAFHIKTNVPVVAYQMLPYGGGRARVTGATLLLPTNVWDGNYVAVNAYQAASLLQGEPAVPTLAIIGSQDNTNVTIRPTNTIVPGGSLAGTPTNVSVTYTLNKGEYLQFSQADELTGSAISADAPIAVIGGATLMDIPIDNQRADTAEQMLPPVRALGSEYVAVRYRSRNPNFEESVPWRVVGAVDGTRLTYDPGPPPGAPTFLNAHQLVEFSSPGPFVVRSQDTEHPFYLASYMTGGKPFGTQPIGGIGDPEFVNVISPAQYLPRYTFFSDPTYPETNLVIVRVRDASTGRYPDVTLDCAGLLGHWAPVGLGGKYQFTRFDLSSGDFVGQNGCDNGVHTATASFPNGLNAGPAAIGITVWGWGNEVTYPPDDNPPVDEANPKQTRWVSYGYPAGANLKKLNSVVVPAN